MDIVIDGIDKSFGTARVLRNVSCTLRDGGIYCLMGPSGVGKTTLLRIVLGLERADMGRIEGIETGAVSAMFQEDRLCETLTAVENVALVMPSGTSRGEIRRKLEMILPRDCMRRPVMQLSGGMRRRVALARAVAYPGRTIVLDEPFTGLDGATKRTVIDFLISERQERTLVVCSHSEEDVTLLGAEKLLMENISHGSA